MEEETINHALFLCIHAFAIWRYCGIPTSMIQSWVIEDNITALFYIMNGVSYNEPMHTLSIWTL